jgi:hypothetical protein
MTILHRLRGWLTRRHQPARPEAPEWQAHGGIAWRAMSQQELDEDTREIERRRTGRSSFADWQDQRARDRRRW